MKDIFENICSNTLSANGNQTYITEYIPQGTASGLVFIKVFRSGTFKYRFIYSGIIDSTFADGKTSKCNCLCSWTINRLSAAVAKECTPGNYNFTEILFEGKESVFVGSEKYISSDSTEITAQKNEYICLKIEFSGKAVPCHKESIIPVYRCFGDEWKLCPEVPVPVITGIEYEPEMKIAFLGDSITQGIGSTFNSYKNFAAEVSEAVGEKNAYWNLGLGYGRASDAASDGIWLEKAKKNDLVILCFGVNDIFKECNAEKLKKDLLKVTSELKKAGTKILIQTIPPFDYDKKSAEIWFEVNLYIRTVLSEYADGFFDCVPILSLTGGDMPKAKYGGHPNDEGCKEWAKALLPKVNRLLGAE